MLAQKTYNLNQNDQSKITIMITQFAKSEPNLLKYSQVITLFLDRCIFNTKYTLVQFHPLFEACLKVKSSKASEKTEVQGERVINKQQIIFLFNESAKILYKPDPNYLQRFYLMLLSEKMEVEGGQINRARVMIIDDISKKLIVEEVVQNICHYSQEIKHIFISYMIQNYWSLKKKKRLLLTFRQMLLQNKRWSYFSLILFLKESELSPHLITVEHVEEIMRMIIPNINGKQQEFYSRHIMSEAYHKDADGQDGNIHLGDPGIMLFQLQLLFIRIAWDAYPKDLQKKDLGLVMQRLIKYLYLRKNNQLDVALPSINRKMINKMKDYYHVINNDPSIKSETVNNNQQNTNLFQKLAIKMQKQINNAPNLGLDFNQMFKIIDRELTKLPPAPKVQPQYVGKYDKNFAITIGQQPPPEPVQKNEKAQKAEKKDAGKKDQIPARQFKWAQAPQVKLATQDYLKQIQQKLNFEVKPLTDISRGVLEKQSYPVMISQVLFPPELPKAVVPFIQASNNALIDKNFILAIDNLNQAITIWKKSSVQFDSLAQLFFEYSKGNIYMIAGKYQYAFQSFYGCRKFTDTSRLPFTNPDRSLAYYGMGEVFYEMQEYQLAARSFLKARQIRQSVLGLQHVQTASTFNNLGCCFYMLGRGQQALGYIEIAEVVLDTELGPHHQRTMTCRKNLKKISHGALDNKPQFRKFWQVFEEDKFQKKKKKKKDGEKKGKK